MTIEKDLQTKDLNELYRVVLELQNTRETEMFLRDIATISELKSLSERWQVAKLIEKKVPYREISKRTGVSTATITRVAHWVNHGMGGYKLLLERTSARLRQAQPTEPEKN